MGGEDFLSALGSIANALFLIASIYIYIALLRQINRRDRDLIATDRGFGAAEVALAVFLIAVFAFSSLGASSAQIVRLRTPDLILNAVVAVGIVLFVAAFLKLRRFNISELTGLARLSFARAFVTGLVLLIFAYPLIIFADWLTARLLGAASRRRAGSGPARVARESSNYSVARNRWNNASSSFYWRRWSPPWPRNSSSVSFFTGSYGAIWVVALDSSFPRFFSLRSMRTFRHSRRFLFSEVVLLLLTSGADRCWSR